VIYRLLNQSVSIAESSRKSAGTKRDQL